MILLDINMPELDGFEMARIIRQTDKRVIIFFLTDRTDKVWQPRSEDEIPLD